MPIFQYKGFDQRGRAVKGLKEADSVKAVRTLLRREGVLATEIADSYGHGVIKEQPNKSVFSRDIQLRALFQRVSVEDLSMMTRQLGTLLSAGVPMVDSLIALIEQVENESLKRVLSKIKSDVNEGASLADSMSKHKAFSNIYINMVRAGETSGALEIVLERLADFTQSQSQLRSKVVGAMLYPAVMVVVAMLVMVIMMTSVVPRIMSVFENTDIKLPVMTRMLVFASTALQKYWWIGALVFGLGGFLFFRWIKRPHGKAWWDRFRLKLPVFGGIVRMIAIARFSRTLATLLSSGVPLLNSLQIVRNVVANDALEKAVDDVRDAVREGQDIATPLKLSGQFPPMVTHMVAVGEKTGQLENMLARVADSYEQRVQSRVGMLTGLLEPIMILTMGATIGFIVFAILTPILQMSQLVR